MSAAAARPLAAGLRWRLSAMMFLQYAIWGVWLPLAFPFLNEHRGFTSGSVGWLIALGGVGSMVAPFVAGPIADRLVSTEKLLAALHLAGAVLVWQLAEITTFRGFLVFSVAYALVYAPTLSLTNSIAFHNLPDRDRDFGKVRVWGTVGWIAVGIAFAQYLRVAWTPADAEAALVRATQVEGMADAFRTSAVLGALMGLYCLTLPHTPPFREGTGMAIGAALRAAVRSRALRVLLLVALPVGVVHQFYFVHTAGFLGRLDVDTGGLRAVFGEGGGGLMTVGQIAEIAVLAAMPWLATRFSRKALLATGLAAYVLRFAVFAYLPWSWAVVPALALHGLCFGAFVFVGFLVVDEETTRDVKASAQSLFNLVIMGVGMIAGSWFAGAVGDMASPEGRVQDFELLFSVPMWVSLASLAAFLALYPGRRAARVAAPVEAG